MMLHGVYAQSRGINCVPRAVTTHSVCTHTQPGAQPRPRTHAAISRERERKKKTRYSFPQKYLKSLPQTTAIAGYVCVWFLSSIIYWDQFFDQSTRTTRIPCPQVANYRVRAASSRKTHGPRKMFSCDCFSRSLRRFVSHFSLWLAPRALSHHREKDALTRKKTGNQSPTWLSSTLDRALCRTNESWPSSPGWPDTRMSGRRTPYSLRLLVS
jgi:hypothetical protein